MEERIALFGSRRDLIMRDAGFSQDGFVLPRSRVEVMRKAFKERSKLITKLMSSKGEILKKRPEYAALYTELEEGLKEFNTLEKLLNISRENGESTEELVTDARKYMEMSSDAVNKLEAVFFLLSVKEDCKELMGWYTYLQKKLVMVNLKSKEKVSVEVPGNKLNSYDKRLIGAPSTVKIDSTFYFMGGFDGEKVFGTVYKLMIHSIPGDLIELAPLKLARYDIAAAQLCKKYLLAISGTRYENEGEVHARNCELYSVSSNKWRNLHPLNIGRAMPGLGVFNDRFIFVYGGQIDGSHSSRDLETYDILDDESGWTIYRNFDEKMGIFNATSGLAQQISNNEILLLSESKMQILKLNGEQVLKVTIVDKNYSNYFYSRITCYNGKVYWNSNSKLEYYNPLTKTGSSSFTSQLILQPILEHEDLTH